MKNLPLLTSKYVSSNSDIFQIMELISKDKEIWVVYKNEKSNKIYSCLIGAFLNRFNLRVS